MAKNYFRKTPKGNTPFAEYTLNTKIFLQQVKKLGFKIIPVPDFYGFCLEKNGERHLLYEQTFLSEHAAVRAADNKMALRLLRSP